MEFCSLILVVMISVAYSGFVSATVEGNSFAVRNGWKNFGGLLASYRVRSRIDCMRACLTSQECNSVNLGSVLVGRNRVECELVTTDQNSLTSIQWRRQAMARVGHGPGSQRLGPGMARPLFS